MKTANNFECLSNSLRRKMKKNPLAYLLLISFSVIPDKENLEFAVANITKEEMKNSLRDVKKGCINIKISSQISNIYF